MTQTRQTPGPARSAKVQDWLDSHKPLLLIGNQWVPAKSGKTFETVNPATGQVIGHAAEADKADVDEAVRAARAAFETGPWPRMAPAERSRILRRFADLIEANIDELCELETLDNGMLFTQAKAFTQVGIECMHYFAGNASAVSGHTMPAADGAFNYILREPIGVVGAIIPWNVPIIEAIWKIGPALAVGNTLLLKPAEQTPLSACRLGELALEAGFPPGVLNILTGFGPGAGSSIVEHMDVDKVSFTGSTEVGKRIVQASSGNLKRVMLELGGKSPNIIFPDANMDLALPVALAAFTLVCGQGCGCGTRLFVQQDIKDEFVEKLAAQAAALKMGDPLDEATQIGPLASLEQFERVRGYLDAGHAEGAVARIGGSAAEGPGYFVRPTIFDGVKGSMRIAREEIFGPVLSVIPFKDEEDAVFQANDTTYGLASAVWTRDVNRAHRVARWIKAGTVWVNTYLMLQPNMPFGGYKQSGLGRELGPNWFRDYTEEKAVYVNLNS